MILNLFSSSKLLKNTFNQKYKRHLETVTNEFRPGIKPRSPAQNSRRTKLIQAGR